MADAPMDPRLKTYTLHEVSAITRKSLTTLYAWIKKGKLITSQPAGPGGEHLVTQEALDRLLNLTPPEGRPALPAPPEKDGDT